MERIELLTKLVKNAKEDIKADFMAGLKKNVQTFKNNGIVSNMHSDCNNEDMLQNTEEGKILKAEWFAGKIISLYEKKKYLMINVLFCTMANDICK